MFGWHVPAPNQAMLISGGRQKGNNPLPVKIVTGHGSFVVPIRSRVSFLTLAMQEALVTEECVTQQGITLLVRAVIAFKVGDDQESISNAARRFLADQDQMSTLTGQIFRLVADPVHRRPGFGVHQGAGRSPPGHRQSGGADRSGEG